MQFRFALVPVAATMLLAACSSSTSASKSNFAKAINARLEKSCVSLDPGYVPSDDVSYPVKIALSQLSDKAQADQQNAKMLAPFNALVKAGLLTVADTEVSSMLMGDKPTPGKVYSLTEEGKNALDRSIMVGRSFCAGHYKVDEIVNYTVPGKGMGGITGSEVNFTYVPADVPSWATSDAIKSAFPDFYQTVTSAQPKKGHIDLVLMSDGWHVDGWFL